MCGASGQAKIKGDSLNFLKLTLMKWEVHQNQTGSPKSFKHALKRAICIMKNLPSQLKHTILVYFGLISKLERAHRVKCHLSGKTILTINNKEAVGLDACFIVQTCKK
jgi:hypothetical protein